MKKKTKKTTTRAKRTTAPLIHCNTASEPTPPTAPAPAPRTSVGFIGSTPGFVPPTAHMVAAANLLGQNLDAKAVGIVVIDRDGECKTSIGGVEKTQLALMGGATMLRTEIARVIMPARREVDPYGDR